MKAIPILHDIIMSINAIMMREDSRTFMDFGMTVLRDSFF